MSLRLLLALSLCGAARAEVSFEARQPIDSNFAIGVFLDLADMDDDHDLDVLGCSVDRDEISWWENNGSGGGWTKHRLTNTVGAPEAVEAVDLDGDGDLDAAACDYSAGDILWFENTNGAATAWTKHTVEGSFAGAFCVVVGDVDGDTQPDLAGAAYVDDDVSWWERTSVSPEAWMEHVIDSNFAGAFFIDLADFDGDDDLDAVAAGRDADAISWWENTDSSGEAWTEHSIATNYNGPTSVDAGDLDDDGDVDVAAAALDGNLVSWFEQTPTGWERHDLFSDYTQASQAVIVDLDQDGDLDLLAAGIEIGQATWLENVDGHAAQWATRIIDADFNGADAAIAGDLNGDSILDVIGISLGSEVAWWRGVVTDPRNGLLFR